MRIGSLSNVNIDHWTPSHQRTTVRKQVPGFIATQTYDIVARNNTLSIKGYLVGTSTSDLATQAMTLKGYANQRKVVWIDASDQYQGYVELCRITDLQGPIIDASKGALIADFTMKCAVLLPWGTTVTNPYNQSGIVLRDLNGVGKEYMLNPLEFNCNFQLNEQTTPHSFSWEFILDNQNAFSGSQSIITECESTINWSSHDGTGVSFANDTTIFKQGTASLLCSGTPTSGGTLGFAYTMTAMDLTNFDFLLLWIRADYGGNSSGSAIIYLMDASGYYRSWTYTTNANQWYRLVVPIRNPKTISGTLDIAAVTEILIQVTGSTNTSDCWVDEISVDVGNPVYLECMIPDNVIRNVSNAFAIETYAWNGSAYALMNAEGAFGDDGTSAVFYYLDGTAENAIWNIFGAGLWIPAAMTASGNKCNGASGSSLPSTLAYTPMWGTNNRFGLEIRMPPAASDSVSGNYPSNDLSGPMAISKTRIKIVVYYANDDTTYVGI
ncbi:MAG: hypothetical protein JRN52_04570 [Nitrososphaerota archaeon]|nr:hypothetical protein [Nitrososphaerota archaeon]